MIPRLSTVMTTINLSRSGVCKAVRKLGEILHQNMGFARSLQCIDLSENSLKGEDLGVSVVLDYQRTLLNAATTTAATSTTTTTTSASGRVVRPWPWPWPWP